MPYFSKNGRNRLYKYIESLISKMGIELIAIGGIEDHIHILVRMESLPQAVNFAGYIKMMTSKFIKHEGTNCEAFYWQRGYSFFPVSPSMVSRVRRYIKNQEEHHKKMLLDKELDFFSRF